MNRWEMGVRWRGMRVMRVMRWRGTKDKKGIVILLYTNTKLFSNTRVGIFTYSDGTDDCIAAGQLGKL